MRRQTHFLRALAFPACTAPAPALALAALSLLTAASSVLQIPILARTIDAVIHLASNGLPLSGLWPGAAALIVLLAVQWLAPEVAKYLDTALRLRVEAALKARFLEKTASLPVEIIEQEQARASIHRVDALSAQRILNGYSAAISLLSLLIQVAGIVCFASGALRFTGLAAALIAAALGLNAALISGRFERAEAALEGGVRRYEALSSALTDRAEAAERIFFQYSEAVDRRYLRAYDRINTQRRALRLKKIFRTKLGSLLASLAFLLAGLSSLPTVMSGQMSLGFFVSMIRSILSLVQALSWSLATSADELLTLHAFTDQYRAFEDLPESPGALKPLKQSLDFESLEFLDVSFAYPGGGHRVLDHCSFRIEKGRHYAFVGRNGSGKTTVVKLIAGLYDGYDGRILLNGRDIRTIDPVARRSTIAMLFQDFARYMLPLRLNVKLARPGGSEERYRAALRDAGVPVAVLTRGEDASLGRLNPGDQDLSGGEWQRVAMAQLLYHPGDLKILDEPTAALDPMEESRLYRQYAEITRGATTIFISHRLGSTRLADEILVLDGGRVIERGAHEALMARGGLYQSMYTQQRKWYQ